MQCSVWNALLDTFRPITVLVTELFIFYCVSPLIGEMWTKYSYLQIAGMAGLIYGTAIYNAPNGGSLRLEGQWWALGINLSKEYDEIRREHEVKPKRTNSSVNLLSAGTDIGTNDLNTLHSEIILLLFDYNLQYRHLSTASSSNIQIEWKLHY